MRPHTLLMPPPQMLSETLHDPKPRTLLIRRWPQGVEQALAERSTPSTEETRTAMGMKVVDNVTAFFSGREPPDRVA